jgi:hypothetical protein
VWPTASGLAFGSSGELLSTRDLLAKMPFRPTCHLNPDTLTNEVVRQMSQRLMY